MINMRIEDQVPEKKEWNTAVKLSTNDDLYLNGGVLEFSQIRLRVRNDESTILRFAKSESIPYAITIQDTYLPWESRGGIYQANYSTLEISPNTYCNLSLETSTGDISKLILPILIPGSGETTQNQLPEEMGFSVQSSLETLNTLFYNKDNGVGNTIYASWGTLWSSPTLVLEVEISNLN